MTDDCGDGNVFCTAEHGAGPSPRGSDSRLALYLAQCLAPIGGVSVRRVGLPYGLFRPGIGPDTPVALVYRWEVYLKAGPDTVTRFIAAGMRPFRPGPRQPLRGYWRVPPDVLADAPTWCAWAAEAADAALRFGRRRPAPRRRKRHAKRAGE